MSIIIIALLATVFVVGLGIWAVFRIRRSAASYSPEKPTWWTFAPANMGGLVVGKQNVNERKEGTGTVVKGGGGVTNVIHSIPGKKRQKVGSDPTAWPMVDGEEDWGFVHWITGGAFFLGPLREMRNNSIHELRFAKSENKRGDGESEETGSSYDIRSRDYDTTWVHYSGALAIKVREAETQGTLTVDIDMNVIYERKFFARSLLRVADANAQLTIMANRKVVGITGTLKPEEITAGAEKVKDDIAEAVMKISPRVEEQIGLAICDVEYYSFDIDDEERKLLQLAARTEREQAARIQIASAGKQVKQIEVDAEAYVIETRAAAEKKAGILRNDVQADFTGRVTIPIANSANGGAALFAQAYENNKTVVVSNIGGNPAAQILPPELLAKKPIVPAEKEAVEVS